MKKFLMVVTVAILTISLAAGCVGGAKTYSLTVGSTAGGSVTQPGEASYTYDEGAVVKLQAVAEEGYMFDGWTGDVTTVADTHDASTIITMNGDYTITVNFIKTHTDPGQTISIGVNQEFIIALGSNPTTGYSWQESHDETMVRLVKSEYEMGKEAKEGLVGAGGIEYLQFKALKTGKTDITMVYKRPWEEPTPQDVTKVFIVDIK